MRAQDRVICNDMLRDQILHGLNSNDLLQARLVCKLWRDDANRIIRHHQQQFFFSPSSKTSSSEGYNDSKWKKNWENVLQISFIYSPKRDTFIRASHRLIDANGYVNHLEASSTDPQERRIESSYFQEIEDYHNGTLPGSSPDSSFHCKMTGHTLDEFTDYLESIPTSSDRNSWEHSILPYLSFRFEGDRLWDRSEVSRFFTVMGPKIRYLTVAMSHIPTGEQRIYPTIDGIQPLFNHFDHYLNPGNAQAFGLVPNLQVLTIMMHSQWFNTYEQSIHRMNFVQKRAGGFPQVLLFGHLKCLRVVGLGNKQNGHFSRVILDKANVLERVIFEMGLSPSVLPALGDVNFESVLPRPGQYQIHETFLSLLPSPIRVIITITGLCLQIFKDSPQAFQYMAQILDLQQALGKGQKVKALQLLLMNPPENYDKKPYNSPVVPPLLRVLKAVARSLETLSLVGGAGLFLEGLIQMAHFNHDSEKDRLESFPNVRKLFISIRAPNTVNRTDFRCWSSGLNLDSSVTSLQQVFPQVEELKVEGSRLWECFLPRPNLAKSVKKLTFGLRFSTRSYDVCQFPCLETLCLNYQTFVPLVPAIWTVSSLQTLMINRIESNTSRRLESLFSGLSNDIIRPFIKDLEKSLPTVPEIDREQFLEEKRAVLKSLLDSSSKCILDLGQLKHLKLFCTLPRAHVILKTPPPVISQIKGLVLLLNLLPLSCHLTIWAMCPDPRETQPLSYQTLAEAVGPMVSAHPRVALRTVRAQNESAAEYPV